MKSTILVTGGAGFIGSNLVEALLRLGHKVRVLDDFSTGKRENIKDALSSFDDKLIQEQFTMIEGDIRNYETCKQACDGADYVLHQAALGSIPRSIRYPLLYEEVNIKGTLNIFEAAREAKVQRLVFASSSSVYGDSAVLPKREGEEGIPLSPYAITKKVNEMYGRIYFKLYGLQTIGLRYFNVFGKRQDPFSQYAAVIPKFVSALLKGQQPTVNGDGTYSRDFTYVDNVVQANLKAAFSADDAALGKTYNIACGKRTTLNELYRLIANCMGSSLEPVYGPVRQGDVPHSLADITLAQKHLKYTPDSSLEDGLAKAMTWYQHNLG